MEIGDHPGASGGGMIDLDDPRATFWGERNEPFDLTTVDDTARFTAALPADDAATGGIYRISGSRTSMNESADGIDRRTGRPVPAPQSRHGGRTGPQAGVRRRSVVPRQEWYTLALFTTPTFDTTDSGRYPTLRLATLDDYLDHALLP